MNRLLAGVLLLAVACGGARQTATKAHTTSDVQTIDSAPVRPNPIDAPPMLTDESPPPRPIGQVTGADAPPPPTPADEAVRAALPFAPAIGMDPVDGSKISIRATTPTFEFKNKTFYFSSEANKRTFAANPDQYSKGPFTHI